MIPEAVRAFQFEHEFRCLTKKRNCNHVELIKSAFELADQITADKEKMAEQQLLIKHLSGVYEKSKVRAIEQLEMTRNEWLQVQSLPHGSFASWVDSVFAVATKAIKELE